MYTGVILYRQDITEILLKVALNTLTHNLSFLQATVHALGDFLFTRDLLHNYYFLKKNLNIFQLHRWFNG